MGKTWQPDGRAGITVHIPLVYLSLLPLIAVVAVIALAIAVRQNAQLRSEVDRLSGSSLGSSARERELEAMVARQHAELRRRDDELDAIRLQIEAIEMQLDGIDYLSRQLREELGLPPSAGTWTTGVAEEPAVGGGYAQGAADERRLALVRRRLAAGLAELYLLRSRAQSRAAGADAEDNGEAAAASAAPLAEPANWPARGAVTSPFGWRIFRGRPNYHTGIDVAIPYGSQVVATGNGTVVGSGWQPGYGWSILVLHAAGYSTLYAHLSELDAAVGDPVRPGQVVGLSGSSGNSTGPHLHYEIWKDGQTVDPRPYMDGLGPR